MSSSKVCSHCNGSGRDVCRRCKGAGKVHRFGVEWNFYSNSTEMKYGYYECDECLGRRDRGRCIWCHGTGRIEP